MILDTFGTTADPILSVFCFDTHYYLKDSLVFSRGWSDTLVYTSGSNFRLIPGTYFLPLHEGHYTISS